MISVRFDPVLGHQSTISETPFVTVLNAAERITAESEKNRPTDRINVERHLRPVIAAAWANSPKIFRAIGIETRAGCNASCRFCPVNSRTDPRPNGDLDFSLVNKVATELEQLRFSGTVQLFGNNEPLQDARIVSFVRLFRERCPLATLKLLTNGTLLTVDLAEHLFAAGLSVLTINNYTNGKRLIKSVLDLIACAPQFHAHDICVSVRNINAVLTTRANRAPNKTMVPLSEGGGFCALPFIDIQVDYRGHVIGCCFDSYSELVIGDIRETSLRDLWFSDAYSILRSNLLAGDRASLVPCKGCDFDGFGDPFQNHERRLTRDDLPLLRDHGDW